VATLEAMRCICVAWDDTPPAWWALAGATRPPAPLVAEPPLLAVTGRERGLRRHLNRSPADALVEAAACPVVVTR
jgi:hypothetical protein